MKKFDLSVLTIAILLVGVAVLGLKAPAHEEAAVVATVNGTAITEKALYDVMKEQSGEQALDQLVTETLIKAEAQKLGVTATKEDLKAQVEKMKSQAGTPEQFEQFLKSYNMTEEELGEKLIVSVLVDKIFADDLKVTEDEMQKFYAENKVQFGEPAPEFDSVKDRIKTMIEDQKKNEKIPTWLEGLKKEAKVERHDKHDDKGHGKPGEPGEGQGPEPAPPEAPKK